MELILEKQYIAIVNGGFQAVALSHHGHTPDKRKHSTLQEFFGYLGRLGHNFLFS